MKVTSGFAVLVLIGVGYAASRSIPPWGVAHIVGTIVAWVPPTVAIGALLFVVSGYELDAGELRIQRLLWTTVMPLAGLESAWHELDALKGSLKVFGNGGLFAFNGVFQSPKFGRFRAFLTDPKRAVVLKLPRRVIAISPADPLAFLESLRVFFPHLSTRE